MRFDKEARTAIYEASPAPATISWPAGAPQPEPGKLYWLQSQEDAKKAQERREYSPATCAEVMADMHNRLNADKKKRKPKRRRRPTGRPTIGDPRIKVLDAEILEEGWKATVTLYEDPDPVLHTGLKTRVPAGQNAIDPELGYEPAELEPEQIAETPFEKHRRRLEEQEALKLENAASVDRSAAMKAEQKLLNQRRRGRQSKLKEEAVERAKKRAELVDAGAPV
jgi:hypothetical protein